MKPFASSLFKSPPLLALAAGLLGFVLNGVGLPVLGGVEITFGGWIPLLITCSLGWRWGLLATVLAFSRTWLELGHPWVLACAALEALIVGHGSQPGQRHLARVELDYWLWFGLPVAGLGVIGLTDLPFPISWATALKIPLNGLLMAAIALPLCESAAWRRLLGLPPVVGAAPPLGALLARRVGLVVVLAVAALGLGAGALFNHSAQRRAETQLITDGHEVSLVLASYLEDQQRALAFLASQLDEHGPANAGLGDELARLRAVHPGFVTLAVADASGPIAVVGRNPASFSRTAAEHDFFRQALATGQPVVTRIPREHGVGTELAVAFSLAVPAKPGRPARLLEGLVGFGPLAQTLSGSKFSGDRALIVVDPSNRVVASSGPLPLPLLNSLGNVPLLGGAEDYAGSTFFIDKNRGGWAERFLIARCVVPSSHWEVYVAEPVWAFERVTALVYLLTALIAAAATLALRPLARRTAREITEPLTELAGAVHRLAQQQPPPAEAPPAPHPARELTEISGQLRAAADAFSETNRRLRGAIDERDRTHAQFRDVTTHLEEKIRERTAQLEEARAHAESANAAKSEFLASMSHELRTPLNVILGNSELLAEQTLGPLNERQAQGVQGINESGRHLLDLINDILDLSKIEAGMLELDLQPTEIAPLCEASLRFVLDAARRKQIRLETNLHQRTPAILADERRLKQILVNLLSNAVKFTPDGGAVGLDVLESPDPAIIRFEVWDTGIGIDAKHFKRIFQPFQQIDSSLARQYAGTGLGLALVQRMVKLHGGVVTVQSVLEHGSRFTVALPRRTPAGTESAPARSAPAGDPPVPVRRHTRILLAEDNDANTHVFEQYFRVRGCQLIRARNGQEAIELALADPPDLVLMDVHMPVMDGFEAMRRLRADPRTTLLPIIAVTALAMPEDRARCLEAGATAYLSKPINLRALGHFVANFASSPSNPSEHAR